MKLINETGMAAGYTVSMDPDGREALVVVVKGTFRFPQAEADPPDLADEQAEFVMTDESTGEPGSPPFASRTTSPRGSPTATSFSPGVPTPRAPAHRPGRGLTPGRAIRRSFDVVGHRVWQAGAFTLSTSKPEPFTRMPFTYDQAFGGVDRARRIRRRSGGIRRTSPGPAGTYQDTKFLDGNRSRTPRRPGRPSRNRMAPTSRWPSGPSAGPGSNGPGGPGTYDQKWRDEEYPFLPKDFDERYNQAAADDQWIEYPRGTSRSSCRTSPRPAGPRSACRPNRSPWKSSARGPRNLTAVVDTLLFEPDLGRFR